MIRSKREKEVGLSEEEKKIAAKLKELAEAANKEETEETDYEQMSPIEQLSADIAAHLANNAACRMAGIIEEGDHESAKQLVIRFENSDSRTLVRMIHSDKSEFAGVLAIRMTAIIRGSRRIQTEMRGIFR